MNSFISPADWVKVSGVDAKDFLHRLTTTDFRNLLPGESAPGFFLNDKGKIRAAFQAHALTKEAFLFRIPISDKNQWTEKFLAVIDQMTFSEKMTIERLTPLFVVEILLDSIGTTAANESGFLALPWGARDYGRSWLTVVSFEKSVPSEADSLPARASKSSRLPEAHLEALRIRCLTPNWETEIQPDTNPLDLGMKEAIAENKGCYPGQEVIEKIISLGSPARRLCLMERLAGTQSTAAITAATTAMSSATGPLFMNGEEVGILTSLVDHYGLAILKRNALTHLHFSRDKAESLKSDGGEWKLVKH